MTTFSNIGHVLTVLESQLCKLSAKLELPINRTRFCMQGICRAIDAMKGDGNKKNNIWLRTGQEGNYILVEIADDGPGIPHDVQSRIFEPFFTTKGVGVGTGLGLNISYRIVSEMHHGSITFNSQPGDTCS